MLSTRETNTRDLEQRSVLLRRLAARRPTRAALSIAALVGTLAACGTGADSTVTPNPTTVTAPTTSVARPTGPVDEPVAVTAPTTSVAPSSAAHVDEVIAVSAPTTPVARPTGPVDELVAVGGGGGGGARLHVRCAGAGDTTVVLIAGFEGSSDTWGAVTPAISQQTRVCSYDRFGTGTSDPPPTTQTSSSQAEDLKTLLQSIGEPAPYVVVGHSFGGAVAVSFASSFPAEVSGLLLLDASPTTWPSALCAVTDDGSEAARSFQAACAMQSEPANNVEHLDVHASFAEVADIASLGALPMIVATAADHPYAGLAATETARLNDVWNAGQQHWVSLSSNAQLVSVDDTSHDIQLDQPGVVIDQIRQLLS